MKKYVLLAVILFSTTAVFAQEKPIEKAEFDAVMVNSYNPYRNVSHREITTSEATPDVTLNNKVTMKNVTERTVQRMTRRLYEFDSPTLKNKIETIIANGRIYMRRNDGEWEVRNPEPQEKKEYPIKMIEEQTEYKLLGNEILNDKTTTVYAKIYRRKSVSDKTGSEINTMVTTKYWIGENGGIVKQEENSESRVTSPTVKTESTTREMRVTTWEIDPSIKIELPTIAALK